MMRAARAGLRTAPSCCGADPTSPHSTGLCAPSKVHGVRVREALLGGGEVVRIGQTSLRVDLLNPAARVEVTPTARFGRLVGSSVEMRRLYPLFEALAKSEVPVVIEGE